MTMTGAMPNAYQPGKGSLSPGDQALVARRTAALGPAYRLFYESPVHLVRGDGVWLYDANGDAYLDAYNNVASVGHCHPAVVAATARQSALFASHTRYLHDTVLDYAEALLATHAPGLSNAMFTCTGSEANDLALRIARAHTGGSGFIVTENAYHGVTEAIAGLSPSLGAGVDLGAHIRTIAAPDPQRMPGDLGCAFAGAVQRAIDDMRRHGIKPAGLIVDTIFSSDGIFADPPGFLAPAVAAIRAAGGVFIADEVQAGFGRTGDAMWGYARHGLIPEIVTMGKPMGNGYPVAGLVVQPQVLAAFGTKARYFNTFGGNAVAAATAMAVLQVVQTEGLQANAHDVGGYFEIALRDLAKSHPCIGAIRSAGLFIGVDVIDGDPLTPDAARTARIVNGMRDARVLISSSGPRANVLKIRPPLVFSRENVDYFIERLEGVLVQA